MDPLTKNAVTATLHCLLGCSIGEVLGMIVGTAFNFDNTAMILLSIVLAFVSGYSLTILPIIGAEVPFKKALGVAFASDTISITSMEIMDNAVVIVIPGALNAGLNTVLFWASLAISLVVAFIITVPVNRWLIAKGKGHAVMHEYHHH
ncbi:MAG TPA: DUF4396 domain-containing protein [Candidatus Saccharimonadales bacterium]|jgi:hypothetical protein|nr:DUF4396 domain-containing protein [Candidatus Saccharimonadales bacterium]